MAISWRWFFRIFVWSFFAGVIWFVYFVPWYVGSAVIIACCISDQHCCLWLLQCVRMFRMFLWLYVILWCLCNCFGLESICATTVSIMGFALGIKKPCFVKWIYLRHFDSLLFTAVKFFLIYRIFISWKQINTSVWVIHIHIVAKTFIIIHPWKVIPAIFVCWMVFHYICDSL